MKKTVMHETSNQIEIDRSQFHAYFFPLRAEEDFKALHKRIKKQHGKATHVCYAYICGERKKFSDDGEPSKTAGFPILELIAHHQLDEVVIFSVRYFGGIKLGTGGLIRAYTSSALSVIDKARYFTIEELSTYQLTFQHSLIHVIDRFLNQYNINVLAKEFEVDVCYHIATSLAIREPLIDLTNNQITILFQAIQKYYLPLTKNNSI